MAISSIFNVKKQLTFYGAYHHDPTNIMIHEIFVPVILWSVIDALTVMAAFIPTYDYLPAVHIEFNEYLIFDLNVSAIHALLYILFYLVLEPTAALLYAPQLTMSLLTATTFSYIPNAFLIAGAIHIVSWIAQFIGHYGPEGRAPALLDNLVGAVVLAPFFVHLELLFKLGYNPELQKALETSVETELARIHVAEGEKRSKKAM
ncbi:hypothetical protein B0H21DRAFT_692324 [Amylocystis lapponica]|nr:hypothetical protein B0H21DRAFT_692324 [Amylocystis lapponica]